MKPYYHVCKSPTLSKFSTFKFRIQVISLMIHVIHIAVTLGLSIGGFGFSLAIIS
jgi:hypothetical protein